MSAPPGRAGHAPDVSAPAARPRRWTSRRVCRRRRAASGSSWRATGARAGTAAAVVSRRSAAERSRADRSAEPHRSLRLRVGVLVDLPDWGDASRRGALVSHAAAGMVRRGRLGVDAGNRGHGAACWARSVDRTDHRRGCGAGRSPSTWSSADAISGLQGIPPCDSRWRSMASRSHAGTPRPGFFVHEFDLPAGALAGSGPLARLTIGSRAADGRAIATAIEQFDLQTRGTLMWAYRRGLARGRIPTRRSGLALDLGRARRCASSMRARRSAITLRVERPAPYFDDDPDGPHDRRRRDDRRDRTSDRRCSGASSCRSRRCNRPAAASRSTPIARSCRATARNTPTSAGSDCGFCSVNVTSQP